MRLVSFSLVLLTALINPDLYLGISSAACPTDNPQGRFCKYSDTLNSFNCSIGAGKSFLLGFFTYVVGVGCAIFSSKSSIGTSGTIGVNNSCSLRDSERKVLLFLDMGLVG